jgi:unconventional prefoldin RPB5 interactor 1
MAKQKNQAKIAYYKRCRKKKLGRTNEELKKLWNTHAEQIELKKKKEEEKRAEELRKAEEIKKSIKAEKLRKKEETKKEETKTEEIKKEDIKTREHSIEAG